MLCARAVSMQGVPLAEVSEENQIINELIKEYLTFNNYRNTLSVMIPGECCVPSSPNIFSLRTDASDWRCNERHACRGGHGIECKADEIRHRTWHRERHPNSSALTSSDLNAARSGASQVSRLELKETHESQKLPLLYSLFSV